MPKKPFSKASSRLAVPSMAPRTMKKHKLKPRGKSFGKKR